MDELPAHAKAVLRRAHQQDQAGADEARRRVREGVARAVGPSAGDSSLARGGTARNDANLFARSRGQAQPAVPAGASSGSAPLFGLAGKLAATTVLVALIGTGIALRQRGAESPESGDTRAAQPRPSTSAQLPQAMQEERAVDQRRSTTPQPEERGARAGLLGQRAPSRVSTRDTLALEVALLRQLGEAVSRRDTSEARRLLALHRARFAQPALLEERQGFQALVRCMEESPDALVSSRAFVARYPNSVLTARVLHECEPGRR